MHGETSYVRSVGVPELDRNFLTRPTLLQKMVQPRGEDLFHDPWVAHQTEVVTCETGDCQQCQQKYYLPCKVLVFRLVPLAMVPRHAGSSSPASFRLDAVVSC